MRFHTLCIALALAASASTLSSLAQTADATNSAMGNTTIPALIHHTGVALRSDGKPLTGEASITFLIFQEEHGGEPVWTEAQHLKLDSGGSYEVQLGAASAGGVSAALFSTGESRWLEVQVAGQAPQPRVLLTSVPYAMKAADAATLGGLPASAYALASAVTSVSAASVKPDATASAVTTPGGTAGYLPVFSGASTVDDSILFESGTKVGIDTNTPAATLDVNGTVAARGALTLENSGTASAGLGKNSEPLQFTASAYSSATNAAVNPLFSLQAEPSGNNTATPSGTLNLLFGSGTAPAETGFSISSKGLVKFVPGQTFPGVGTITGVTTTAPLTGSGTAGSVALGLSFTSLENTLNTKYAQLGAANKFTAPITFAAGQTFPGTGKGTITGVTTTAPLTGSGTAGSVALGLNFTSLETTLNTKYAQLGVANKFTAPTTFTAPVTFAASQTFPGMPGGGTITGVTTTSPLAGSGTKGSVALSLNLTALQTTLNASYAQLGAANKFTQPITFAAGQTFPGAGTITGVTAGTGLTGGGTTGAIKLSLDSTVIPTLTGSPVFTSPADGIQGITNANYLGVAGVQGQAGNASGLGNGISGVWGDAYAHVGVLGTSWQYSGVQGISNLSYGVQGSSNSNTAVLGTSTSGTGVSGLSTSSSGVAGYTPGTTINTAGVNGKAGSVSGITQIVAGVWGDSYQQVGVEGTSNQSVGVYGQSTVYNGVQGVSTSAIGVSGLSTSGTGIAGSSSTGAGMVGYTGGNVLNTGGVIGIAGPRTNFSGISGVWGDAANHVGVEGTSNVYAGVQGTSVSGPGVQGTSNSGAGTTGTSITGNGMLGNSIGGIGVYGIGGTRGIFGETSSTSGGDAAVYGYSHNNALGVFGFSPKFGVEGVSGGNSQTGGQSYTFVNGPGAVWGDGGAYAVTGTTDDGVAGQFLNNSYSQSALYAVNNNSFGGSHVADFGGTSGGCSFFGNGDVLCTGTISSANVTNAAERAVKTYSVQSTESWYEDAGSAHLVNGVVHVRLDSTFAQTANTGVEYHVFLTPGGDSEGLYVTNKTADGFDVHEQHGGHSNIAFDYRIMAKRTGHERERLEDVTEQVKKQAKMRAQMVRADGATPAAADAVR